MLNKEPRENTMRLSRTLIGGWRETSLRLSPTLIAENRGYALETHERTAFNRDYAVERTLRLSPPLTDDPDENTERLSLTLTGGSRENTMRLSTCLTWGSVEND